MALWYHYICETNLRRAARESALKGHNRFIRLNNADNALPEQATDNAIWGFRYPEAALCKEGQQPDNPHLETVKKQVAYGERLYLLEITTAETDKTFICDTAVFKDLRSEKFPKHLKWDSKKGIALRKAFDKKAKAYNVRYWESLIPFDEYRTGQYEEPEVVCFNDIPLEHIRLVHKNDDFVPARTNNPIDWDLLLGN